MKKFHSNLAFVDLLFNLLAGFVTLFIIAFLLINPIADTGKIDPKVEIMVTAEWNHKSRNDIDLWMNPPGRANNVGFRSKERDVFNLERDDLGVSNDYVNIDGVTKLHELNLETINIRSVVPGEYFVNVHFYRKKSQLIIDGQVLSNERDYDVIDNEKIRISIIDMQPYKVIATVEVELVEFQELTAFSFIVTPEGNIIDVRTDIQVRMAPAGGMIDP